MRNQFKSPFCWFVLLISVAILSRQVPFVSETVSVFDEYLERVFELLPVARAHDQGLISFFEKECPQGWEEHVKSKGRMIMGTSFDYETEDLGGEMGHQLSIEEMPKHNHFMFTTQGTGQPHQTYLKNFYYKWQTPSVINDYFILGSDGVPTVGKVTETGLGTPFNTVPVNIKLKICEKNSINASYKDLLALIQSLNKHIADYRAALERQNDLKAEYEYYSAQFEEKQKELDSLKKYSPALHIIGIVALVFALVNIVFWVVNFSKYSKAARLVNEMKADDAHRRIDSQR